MEVKVTNDFLFVRTPFGDRNEVQNELNGVWSKKANAHRFPKNFHVMMELVNRYPDLRMNQEFMQTGTKLIKARDRALEMKNLQDDTLGDERLRPYQKVDVNYLSMLPSAGIFNEPRTGEQND